MLPCERRAVQMDAQVASATPVDLFTPLQEERLRALRARCVSPKNMDSIAAG